MTHLCVPDQSRSKVSLNKRFTSCSLAGDVPWGQHPELAADPGDLTRGGFKVNLTPSCSPRSLYHDKEKVLMFGVLKKHQGG